MRLFSHIPYSSRRLFDCKPLGWLWAKFGGRYDEKNTIMFDDLRRNFVMNPGNGLKIRPFRKAHMNRDTDRELFDLTRYLLEIATVEVCAGIGCQRNGCWLLASSRLFLVS